MRMSFDLQHRNKEGILEFKKSDGLKKSWKPFSFKVSASTYLLCSKTADVSPGFGGYLTYTRTYL